MTIAQDWPTPTLADVFKARRAIAPFLPRTPVLEPAGLARALGCRAVLKCENLNPTGAFKVRGGVNLLASLGPDARTRGVVAASTGNHGQSVAYAARLFGVRRRRSSCPRPPTRSRPRRRWRWAPRSSRPAATSTPPGSPPRNMPIAMGCVISIRRMSRSWSPGSPPRRSNCSRPSPRSTSSSSRSAAAAGCSAPGSSPARSTRRSASSACRPRAPRPSIAPGARAGASSPSAVTTFAEGLATREPFEMPLALFPRLVDEIMLVDDHQLAAAIRLVLDTARQVAEGAAPRPSPPP